MLPFPLSVSKFKVKVALEQTMKPRRRCRSIAVLFIEPRRWTGSGWSTPSSSRFTPRKDPVPIVQEAGWAPGPFWTGAENIAPSCV